MAQQCCLIRCRHCRIFFLTHPRNQRRLELVSCPFGCRQERERRESRRRSAAYYREHPEKKHALNQKRYRLVPRAVSGGVATAETGINASVASAEARTPVPQLAGGATAGALPGPSRQSTSEALSPPCPPELAEVLPKAQDPEVIGHVRVIVSLIEGRPVSLAEIWETLLKISRQRTIGQRRPIDHTVAWLNTHPP